jgi:long-subunit acyl-CoA synthetase (AMP-forming)
VTQLVHEFVASSVHRFGDRTALVDANGTLTYHAMWDRSRRLALVLRGLGVQRGDRVAAIMHNRNEWVEVDCAVSMVGGIRGGSMRVTHFANLRGYSTTSGRRSS